MAMRGIVEGDVSHARPERGATTQQLQLVGRGEAGQQGMGLCIVKVMRVRAMHVCQSEWLQADRIHSRRRAPRTSRSRPIRVLKKVLRRAGLLLEGQA